MALFVWTTPRPDIHASFQAWEASWDHDFKRNYEPPDRLPESGSLSRLIRSSSISLLNSDHSVMFTEQVATNLMGTQVKLSVMAAQVWESFEVDWKRASDARRRACIEKGVYCSALSAPPSQAETERKWCPETSVNHLASDGGQGYLNLVMTLTLPGHVIHAGHIAPIFPSHPAIDRVSNLSTYERNTPGFKAALRIWTLWRAYHLTRVVTDIFLVFYERHDEVTKPVSMDSLNSSMRTALRHITASLSPDAAKKLVIAFKQTHPEAAGPRKGPSGTPCHTCGTASTGAQQGGAKLRTCSACRKVNRFVYYCSSECQRQDWKHGKPYPHKTICGKLRSEQEIEELSNTKGFYSAEELMPKAEPSFRRSTALNRQISCLAADIRLDYVLFVSDDAAPGGQKRVPVTFVLSRRALFILHRYRGKRFEFSMPCTDTPDLTTAISAFKTGDAWSVRVMYALLLGGIEGEPSPVFSDTPIAPSLIRAQLEEEFATTIDSTPLSKVNQHRLSFNATAEEIGLIDRTLDRLSPPEEMGELKQLLKTHGPTPYLMK